MKVTLKRFPRAILSSISYLFSYSKNKERSSTVFFLKTVRFIFVFLVVAVLFGEFANDLFHPKRLYCTTSFANTDSQLSKEEVVRDLANQEFKYLGHGRQSFVFISRDEKIVLKFFNRNYFCLPKWFRDFFFYKKELKKQHKMRLYFSAHRLAMKKFREESGLILLHSPKDGLDYKIKVRDKLGRKRMIDLSKTACIIQRKMTSLSASFENFKKRGELKEGIDAIMDLFLMRSKKGLQDEDCDIVNNIGFVGKKAYLLDPGRLKRKKSTNLPVQADIKREFVVFEKFIKENYKEYLPYLESKKSQNL